jgi:hypothetical protein
MHSFDTHAHVKALITAGLEEPQAEAIIKTLVNSREYDFSKLATKEQLAHLEEKLTNKIDAITGFCIPSNEKD